MLSFKEYIEESIEYPKFDAKIMAFLQNAEQARTFNFKARDLETLDYKVALQWLFKKHWFPKIDLNTFPDNVDIGKINNLIKKLKSMNFKKFENMHQYILPGLGPGEVTLFFLVNNAMLGGGSSAGVDLIDVGGKKYEVKSAQISSDGYAQNFKLGGTLDFSKIMSNAMALKQKLAKDGYQVSGKNAFTRGDQVLARKHYQKEWNAIESEFKRVAYNGYFKNHDIIFMKNNTSGSKEKRKLSRDGGTIEHVGRVKLNDIELDQITSGTIKPRVKM